MHPQSRQLSTWIDRPADEVYAFAADPRNLPQWAAGFASGNVEQVGEEWTTQSPMGPVRFRFVPHNDLGVLDHDVVLPGGETVTNHLRALPGESETACEMVFTLRRRPGMSAEEYDADAAAVERDLETLRSLLEGR